jgi:hypothetical protein
MNNKTIKKKEFSYIPDIFLIQHSSKPSGQESGV